MKTLLGQPYSDLRRAPYPGTAVILRGLALALICVSAWSSAARGGEPAGTVTQLKGAAEVGIGDEWRPLELGGDVPVGGRLRTGPLTDLRVVFRDDTVLDLDMRSEVVIERQTVDPSSGHYDSAITLIRGSIYVHVSERYNTKGAMFLVTSPTASANLAGGDFTFQYDDQADATDIAGLRGQVDVRNILRPQEKGVLITARQATRVARHKAPDPVHVVDSTLIERYSETVTRAGSDWPVLVWQSNPLLNGFAVARGTDAHTVLSGPSPATLQPKGHRSSVDSGHDVGTLLGESPAALSSGGVKFGVGF